MARKASSDTALEELRAFGLAYSGAHTKSPWPNHLDLAVKDKAFAYLTLEGVLPLPARRLSTSSR